MEKASRAPFPSSLLNLAILEADGGLAACGPAMHLRDIHEIIQTLPPPPLRVESEPLTDRGISAQEQVRGLLRRFGGVPLEGACTRTGHAAGCRPPPRVAGWDTWGS